jgi:DNA polymerase
VSLKALKQYLEYLYISGIDDVFLKSASQKLQEQAAVREEKQAILDELRQRILNCQNCELWQGRIKLVYGQGNADAKLMLIGEGPGAEENKTGEAFVGNAGQLLTKMLKAIDLERDEVYIGNIVKCRPPDNRNPQDKEKAACLPFLLEQISVIKPQILLLLGKVAGNTLLSNNLTLGKMRTGIYTFQGIPTYVTYHPAALLRDFSPDKTLKRLAWEDLQRVRNHYLTLPEKV